MPRPLSSLTRVLASRPGRFLAVLAALVVATSPAGAPGDPAPLRAPAQEQPTGVFTWAMTNRDLGSVAVPAIGSGGWRGGPFALRYRPVPGFTSDPTREVILAPPDSGHPTLPERFMVQFPRDWAKRPFDEQVVVVAFHSFSTSEKQIFLDTDLPFECQRRGWMLVAPYGLKDTNFANVASQDSLRNVLFVLHSLLGFNHERIYAVGFSMGGLNAISYAMRHQDPGDPRFAAVASHTGTVDMIREYEAADAFLQLKLRNPFHFGAAPDVDPFAYERVSPARILASGLADREHAPVTNAMHVPFYFHANLADPATELVADGLELKNLLAFRGATVYEHLVVDPVAGHSWSTLPMARVLDALAQHRLPGNPPRLDVHADRCSQWLYTDVLSKPDGTHARYRVELSPLRLGRVNAFRISDTENLDAVRLRLRAMGLDPKAELAFECSSADGTPDVFVLKGYVDPPQGLRVVRARSSSWSHDPARRELRIQVEYRSGPVQVVVRP